MILRDGEGVARNYVAAFSWAQQSAKQGDPVGEAVLGQLYKEKTG
jgi:TPR repeat protein